MSGSAKGSLDNVKVINKDMTAACVILISGGYPKEYKSGYEISGIADADKIENIKIFHAGTKADNGRILTNGGRVLCVQATADDFAAARDKVYRNIEKIKFEDCYYRKDIGAKLVKN